MNVNDTVRRCLWHYASIFKSRADVLHHLFYVLGNGYVWEHGELVSVYDDEYEDRARKQGGLWTNLEQKWQQEEEYNRENIDRLTVETGTLTNEPYPPSLPQGTMRGVAIHHIPDDVKEDWAAAAEEIRAIVEPLHKEGRYLGSRGHLKSDSWLPMCNDPTHKTELGPSEIVDLIEARPELLFQIKDEIVRRKHQGEPQ